MVRSNKLFGSTPQPQKPGMSPTYAQADKVNREGFPAFTRTLEEDTLAVLLCNTLSNTFYADERTLAKETVDVLTRMAQKDADFLAKALVHARNRGLMRLAPVVGLAVLSAHGDGEKKVAFRRVFHHVVKTPDDLREFVSLCRSKQIRKGLGGEARDAVKRWLQHISEYHAVKYGSAKSEGITLRDILRMAHPRPVSEAQRELFGWLVKGWDKVGLEPSPSNPQVWAFEKIKRAETEAEIVALVKKYRLTWEVVVPSVKKMTTGIWAALLDEMPYMALLRNLNTMARHHVFTDEATVKKIAKRLSDPEQVRKSKQFPFRFFNAFKAFEGPQGIRDALADALEQSFENVEALPGRVCVANDISGSMSNPVSDKGKARYCDIAGILAAALFKKQEDVVLLPFDTTVHTIAVSRRDSIMTIAGQIGLAQGGTDVGAPIRYLNQTHQKVDVFIGVTDGEDWAGRGFLTEWEEYRKEVSPNAKAFLVTISPYKDWNAPTGYPSVHFCVGWSDAVLKYIPLVLKGGAGQVEEVKKIDLAALGKKTEEPKAAEEPVVD